MIQCIIDGKMAYPDTSGKIKVTFENQMIKNSGEYTYEVTFPLSVQANREIFGNVDRLDVKKSLPTYQDCRLLSDNRLVIMGLGTVRSISETQVKLQFIGGQSRVKYNSRISSHYIDSENIDYGDWSMWGISILDPITEAGTYVHSHIAIDLSNTSVPGADGLFAFNPVYDESNDRIANAPIVNGEKCYYVDVAIQPYLFYVVKCVLKYEGYTLKRNDYDCEPYNRLVISNARRTKKINEALPHWTVMTFLEELRKLLGGSFVFDEKAKTVDFISLKNNSDAPIATYECTDEFTAEYDEDGLTSIMTSNVEYDMPSSQNRRDYDIISQDILNKFPIIECKDFLDARAKCLAMSKKEAFTSIFLTENGYYYITDYLGESETNYTLLWVGELNPLIREKDSDDTVSLKICPAVVANIDRWQGDYDKKLYSLDEVNWDGNLLLIKVLSATNDKELTSDNATYDESSMSYFISVVDSINGTSETSTEEESTEEVMQIFFQDHLCYVAKRDTGYEYPEKDGKGTQSEYRMPMFHTIPAGTWQEDSSSISEEIAKASLSLQQNSLCHTIGNNLEDLKVDKHNLVTIQFITDDIPDPTNIFIFRNKKYLCSKIEIEINEYGIERMKTGYFYEMFD